MSTTDAFKEFTWRGLVYDATDAVAELLARDRVTLYAGFDPTAPSLHVGHLLPAMALARMQRYGHTPVAVVGGGTGLIGDPSFKSQERVLLTTEQIEQNTQSVQRQLSRLLEVADGPNRARIVNNAEWLATIDLLSFLRETGKHFTVSYLLQKEAVRQRLESEDGISFTEFSYLLLQAYDFLQLFDRYNCSLQVGGSDQWGNITAGIDLIRRVRGGKTHGLVMPLLTTAGGVKFGKTEAGAVWLDPGRTSPFKFYQFWLNTEDRDVSSYLRFFTFLDRATIEALEGATATTPEKREAQRMLARTVTTFVHGAQQMTKAEHASGLLFGDDIAEAAVEDVLAVFEDVPSTELSTSELGTGGIGVAELVALVRLAPSKSEARRLVQAGGIYVNNRRTSDLRVRLRQEDAIGGQLFVLRKGQRDNHLVRLTPGSRVGG